MCQNCCINLCVQKSLVNIKTTALSWCAKTVVYTCVYRRDIKQQLLSGVPKLWYKPVVSDVPKLWYKPVVSDVPKLWYKPVCLKSVL